MDFLKLTLKCRLYNTLNKKNEKLVGKKISSFDYESIKFLFIEVFLWNDYFFITKKKNPVILDCGANIGMATLFFKFLYPLSQIYCFEPDKKTFGLLKKNIKQNNLNDVFPYNFALSDKNGKMNFYIDNKNPGSTKMSAKFGSVLKDKTIADCITLSSFIQQKIKIKEIDFLKIDIEGSEKEVILDLVKNNKFKSIKEGAIEYHHKIGNQKSDLGSFLKLIEKQGFEYQINSQYVPVRSKAKFQDILIHFFKR